MRGGRADPPVFLGKVLNLIISYLDAKKALVQKVSNCTPTFISAFFGPVNSICGQTEGQIRISIAELDYFGWVNYIG